MKFIKTGLIFTSELFLLFKKYGGGGGEGAEGLEFW